MSKTLKQRVFTMMLVVLMAIASIPDSLIAYADDYSGTGGSNTSVSEVSPQLAMNGNEYGIRIYCIEPKCENTSHTHTKDCYKIKTGKGNTAIDLWYSGDVKDKVADSEYSTTCRFGSIDGSKILKNTFAGGVANANNNLKSAKILTGSNSISEIPAFAGFDDDGFYMYGKNFRSWATKGVSVASGAKPWQIVLLFNALTGIAIDTTDYLVMEPIMYLPIVTGPYSNMKYQCHSACTWYGFMKQLGNNTGGTMKRVRTTWANGFCLSKDMAGLQGVNNAGFFNKDSTTANLGLNFTQGWGLHILNSNEPFGNEGDPIDSYNIVNKPGTPSQCEPPQKTSTYDNKGDITIVKTYVDLYKDKNNSNYYTAAIDSGTYIRNACSDKVVISNEFYRTGYSVKAWYTSKSVPRKDDDEYYGTSMLHKSSATASGVGDYSYTIEGYTQMSGVTFNGSKSYKMQKSRTVDGTLVYFDASTNTGNKNYTRTNAIPKTGSISRIKTASTSQYVKLGEDDQTIVILYVREHGYIDSSTFTETSINNDPHQELKIVKCYGIVNPATYEVEDDKDTVYTTSKTRNVNVSGEKGYRFAEFVYCTRGSSSYSSMTASKWCQVTGNEKSKNNQFYVKGFIDGFSASPFGSGTYSSQYAWGIYKPADMATMHGERDRHDSAEYAGGAIVSTGTYKGTIGRGRLSGDILDGYEKTIYFGGTAMSDTTNKNTSDDVLYLLFLKDDEVEYEVGDFGIPESYITRRNNFATNNIKVGGVTGSSSKQYSFAKHQFKYS